MKLHRRCSFLLLASTFLSFLIPPAASAQWSNGRTANAVLGQPDFTTNNSGTSSTMFDGPTDIAVDPVSGKVFVSDDNNNRVLRFSSAAAMSAGAAAEAVLGQPDFNANSLVLDATGMNSPAGIDVDASGNLWVADAGNNRVLRFDSAATKANGASADGVLGQANFTSSGAATSATGMSLPQDVAVDAAGTLWVVEFGNKRAVRFDNAASQSNGAAADGVLGQGLFTTSSGGTTEASFGGPNGVAVDAGGNLWIADYLNNRVLRFANAATKGNGSPADSVLGQADFLSNTVATTAAGMDSPFGVAVDSAGNLWVAEVNNNRVLRFANAAIKGNGAPADTVLGQSDFVSSGSAVTATGMQSPKGVATDAAGNLWVLDGGNSRAIRFSPDPAPFASPDTTRPRLRFLKKRRLKKPRPRHRIKGLARDDTAVVRVEARLRGKGWRRAKLRASGRWVYRTPRLKSGRNAIKVRAWDTSGNRSKTKRVKAAGR